MLYYIYLLKKRKKGKKKLQFRNMFVSIPALWTLPFRYSAHKRFFLCLPRVISPEKRSIQLCGEWESIHVLSVNVTGRFVSLVLADLRLSRWLFRDGLLPDDTYFVGFARSDMTLEDIKTACFPHMKVEALLLVRV